MNFLLCRLLRRVDLHRRSIQMMINSNPQYRINLMSLSAVFITFNMFVFVIMIRDGGFRNVRALVMMCFGVVMSFFFVYVLAVHIRSPHQQQGSILPRGGVTAAARERFKIFLLEAGDLENQHILEENCIICLSKITVGNRVLLLPCDHFYHEQCFNVWIKGHCNCPLCNTNLNNLQSNEEDGRARIENETDAEMIRGAAEVEI
mmetsp:Transcript_4323/g.5672  ORF Transcript_4323/g.5672 Transcript_4323/m.5672 type:complete len:204 (-) Transcript_4323:273-884(-)